MSPWGVGAASYFVKSPIGQQLVQGFSWKEAGCHEVHFLQ